MAAARPSLAGIEHGVDWSTNKQWLSWSSSCPLAATQLRRAICGGIQFIHPAALRKNGIHIPLAAVALAGALAALIIHNASVQPSPVLSSVSSSSSSSQTSSYSSSRSSLSDDDLIVLPTPMVNVDGLPSYQCDLCRGQYVDRTKHVLWECPTLAADQTLAEKSTCWPPCLRLHGILPKGQNDVPLQELHAYTPT